MISDGTKTSYIQKKSFMSVHTSEQFRDILNLNFAAAKLTIKKNRWDQ